MPSNLQRWFGLERRRCVVAGAQGLLGKSCVRALEDAGAEVFEADLTFAEKRSPRQMEVDVSSEAGVRALFSSLGQQASDGREWSVINCSYPRTANWGGLRFENVTAEDWNRNVELHLGSAFLFTKYAVELLKKTGGGSIINLGSIYGLVGQDARIYDGTTMGMPSPYAAIKSGIIGLTRYVATTYGRDRIRANVVCPGGIEAEQPESFREAYESRTPLGRMGTPEDIAGTVAFLAGPSAQYVTGQVWTIDGGWTAW